MPRQLEFWIPEPPPPPAVPRWKDLKAEERTAVITRLVRMITQAVHPRPAHAKEENAHER